jgi:hypothetical protein
MTTHQNALDSTNDLFSHQRMGCKSSNVSNALSKGFKRGMDSQQRSNHHER